MIYYEKKKRITSYDNPSEKKKNKMSKGKKQGTFVPPEFGRIQSEEFLRLIDQGIIEELVSFPKIEDEEKECEFCLFGEEYRLAESIVQEQNAIYECLTYSSDLYVLAQLTNKKNRTIKRQVVLLGSLPLMTSQGFFIINGVSRVVISQILRSPGIYYRRELDHNGFPLYTGTIISNLGGRLKLELDRKARIWVRVSKKRKVSIFILLLAIGFKPREIFTNFNYPEILLKFFKRQVQDIHSVEDALVELYKNLYSITGDVVFSELIYNDLQNKFFRQRFELGQLGRRNVNKKLELDVPKNEYFLLPQDILAAIDHLIKANYRIGTLDDIDHLKNRRVRSVADLLQDQLRLSLERLELLIRQTMQDAAKQKHFLTPEKLVTSTPFITTFKEFFGSHPLSQFMDQTNPLSEVVHKRKVSALGPGGLTKRTASFRVRDIHPSHYGRLCPIETSEGLNAGLISSLGIYAQLKKYGSLESPFYKISNISDEEQIVQLSPNEDERYRIATGSFLAANWGAQEEQFTSARYQQEFLTIPWSQVNFRSFFPLQFFSVGTSLIPFLEHNDANRALMGSNMQRQAVPLSKAEKCIVGTGLEGQIALDSGSCVTSEREGKVIYIDGQRITLFVDEETSINKNLLSYERSNNNTCINQTPLVCKDKFLRQGQIIADGASTVGGELALGKNILVAYMPWEGYNFEDATLISERLIYEDIFTSFHIERHEINVSFTGEGPEKLTREIPHLNNHILRHLDENGLVKLGSWVEAGDVLVGKLTPLDYLDTLGAPEGKLLQAIFGTDVTNARETCLKVPVGFKGRVIDIKWVFHEEDLVNFADTIHIFILQKRKIQVGDKVAGRHGNKGIISKILPRQDMPYLQDGTPVDMILSPLGVPSRMNVGQIFECLLGLAGNFLNKHYRIIPFDERYEREASRKLVFSELYDASKQTSNPWLFEPDHPGKSQLLDGRTGDSFTQTVTVGKAYMMKLIHQVDDKIHARSSGPYALVTQQPVRGKARQGGQRVGEMEVWALEGFGVAYILQEMLTTKSDHIQARYEVLGAIITGKPIPKPNNSVPESFRLLVRELRCLALNLTYDIIHNKDLGKEFLDI